MLPAPRLALLLGLLWACGDPTLVVDVRLVIPACAGETSPLVEATGMRARVYGPGVTTAPVTAPIGDRLAKLPDVPVGAGRQLLVEVLGVAGSVLARGLSAPVDVDGFVRPFSAVVVVRRTGAASPTIEPGAPGSCTHLAQARAGHGAALLPDGRVLLAGGFVPGNGGHRTYLATTELYDPWTGRVSAGPTLATARARAFTLVLPGTGLVALVGGEGDGVAALDTVELVDVAKNRVTQVRLGTARAGAIAVADARGLLVVGGAGLDGKPLASTEAWEPATATFSPGPALAGGRRAAGVAPVTGGWLVGGGRDATTVLASSALILRGATGRWELGPGPALVQGRLWPLAAGLPDGRAFFGAGLTGAQATEADLSTASASTESAEATAARSLRTAATLRHRRADACVALLADGALVIAGGTEFADTGALHPTALEVVRADPEAPGGLTMANAKGALATGRSLATCTALADGTVLVAGGAALVGHDDVGSDALELYQPDYKASDASPFR